MFAATFFFFFGLQIDAGDLPGVMPIAVVLALLTAGTKIATGWWAARRGGISDRDRVRAGLALMARGEFSVVIAEPGIATGLEPHLGPLAAGYVLILAIAGPLLMRWPPMPQRPCRSMPDGTPATETLPVRRRCSARPGTLMQVDVRLAEVAGLILARGGRLDGGRQHGLSGRCGESGPRQRDRRARR